MQLDVRRVGGVLIVSLLISVTGTRGYSADSSNCRLLDQVPPGSERTAHGPGRIEADVAQADLRTKAAAIALQHLRATNADDEPQVLRVELQGFAPASSNVLPGYAYWTSNLAAHSSDVPVLARFRVDARYTEKIRSDSLDDQGDEFRYLGEFRPDGGWGLAGCPTEFVVVPLGADDRNALLGSPQFREERAEEPLLRGLLRRVVTLATNDPSSSRPFRAERVTLKWCSATATTGQAEFLVEGSEPISVKIGLTLEEYAALGRYAGEWGNVLMGN